MKDNAENSDFFFLFFFVVLMTLLNEFLPLALSQLAIGYLLKKVNKPSQESASASKKLRSNQALVFGNKC